MLKGRSHANALTGDIPGPVAVTFTFGNLGQLRGHQGHVVKSRHPRTVLRAAGPHGIGRALSGAWVLPGAWARLRLC